MRVSFSILLIYLSLVPLASRAEEACSHYSLSASKSAVSLSMPQDSSFVGSPDLVWVAGVTNADHKLFLKNLGSGIETTREGLASDVLPWFSGDSRSIVFKLVDGRNIKRDLETGTEEEFSGTRPEQPVVIKDPYLKALIVTGLGGEPESIGSTLDGKFIIGVGRGFAKAWSPIGRPISPVQPRASRWTLLRGFKGRHGFFVGGWFWRQNAGGREAKPQVRLFTCASSGFRR